MKTRLLLLSGTWLLGVFCLLAPLPASAACVDLEWANWEFWVEDFGGIGVGNQIQRANLVYSGVVIGWALAQVERDFDKNIRAQKDTFLLPGYGTLFGRAANYTSDSIVGTAGAISGGSGAYIGLPANVYTYSVLLSGGKYYYRFCW
jgi:hypothetical protein